MTALSAGTYTYLAKDAKQSAKNAKKAEENLAHDDFMVGMITRLRELGVNCPEDPKKFFSWMEKAVQGEVEDTAQFTDLKSLNRSLTNYRNFLMREASQARDSKKSSARNIAKVYEFLLKKLPESFSSLKEQEKLYQNQQQLRANYFADQKSYEMAGLNLDELMEAMDEGLPKLFDETLMSDLFKDDHFIANDEIAEDILLHLNQELRALLSPVVFPDGFMLLTSEKDVVGLEGQKIKKLVITIESLRPIENNEATLQKVIEVNFEKDFKKSVLQNPIEKDALVKSIMEALESDERTDLFFQELRGHKNATDLIDYKKNHTAEMDDALSALKEKMGYLPAATLSKAQGADCAALDEALEALQVVDKASR